MGEQHHPSVSIPVPPELTRTSGWGCEECGAPYGEPVLRWNSGDPKWFRHPSCDCGEKASERWLERLIQRRQAGKENRS